MIVGPEDVGSSYLNSIKYCVLSLLYFIIYLLLLKFNTRTFLTLIYQILNSYFLLNVQTLIFFAAEILSC
jgi:hypothetical protein